MATAIIPYLCNDEGVEKIHIGVKEFKCMGARPPFDHPHVFLDMGGDDQVVCGYCSTLFIYDPRLAPDQTDPPACLYREEDEPVPAG
ncbi:MAG: zinc-finger domain-containing protein [Pseudomonadota bacterium]